MTRTPVDVHETITRTQRLGGFVLLSLGRRGAGKEPVREYRGGLPPGLDLEGGVEVF